MALAAALVLPLQAVPALAQQNVGSLFFLNSQYDSVAVGHVDRQGQFQGTYQSGYWAGYTPSSGWTKVINTANGFLCRRKAASTGSRTGDTSWAAGTFLFFYNPWDGSAAIGHITPAGSFVQTQSWAPGSFGSWTHIVATDNNLIFYNKESGVMAVGHIRFSGRRISPVHSGHRRRQHRGCAGLLHRRLRKDDCGDRRSPGAVPRNSVADAHHHVDRRRCHGEII